MGLEFYMIVGISVLAASEWELIYKLGTKVGLEFIKVYQGLLLLIEEMNKGIPSDKKRSLDAYSREEVQEYERKIREAEEYLIKKTKKTKD